MKRNRQGQALLEFALVLPLLFLLIVNVVNLGSFLYAGITVANAARTGADYMMMGPAYAGHRAFPSAGDITTLVRGDLASLPNGASAVITVCTNNQGAIQPPGTCLATVADSQPTTSVVGQVTITYAYAPLIPFWDFPSLRVHLTLPRSTIRRQATTRLVQ